MSISDVIRNEYNNYNVIKAMQNSIKEDEITKFRGEYFFLSNFYDTAILFKGQIYQNAESAFQSAKCENKIDRMWFMNLSGKEAKRLGKKIELREDWEEVKEDIMYRVVYEKFRQNTYLKKKLLKTGDTEICEENFWGDTEWGVCNGVGQNKLGKILMKVREELR